MTLLASYVFRRALLAGFTLSTASALSAFPRLALADAPDLSDLLSSASTPYATLEKASRDFEVRSGEFLPWPQALKPAPTPKKPDRKQKTKTPVPPGPIKVSNFKKMRWSPEGNYFRSEGHVEVTQTDPVSGEESKLQAEGLDYDIPNGKFKTTGKFVLTRPGARFTGEQIEYNFQTQSGVITEALLESELFQLSGRRITAREDGSYSVLDGQFTTCERGLPVYLRQPTGVPLPPGTPHPHPPDYRIRAARITVKPNQYIAAQRITLYLGPSRILSLPSFRQNMKASSAINTPRPNYNRTEGITLRFVDNPISEPKQTLDYDIRLGARYPFVGFVLFQHDLSRTPTSAAPPLNQQYLLTEPLRGFLEQLTPPTYQEYAQSRFGAEYAPRTTFYAALQHRQFVFNRNRYNLLLSRFPEVGVRFANILGHNEPVNPDGSAQGPSFPRLSGTDVVLQRFPYAPLLLDISASASGVFESPTDVTAGRFGLRINAASQPLLLGRRLSLRFGLTNILSLYTTGTAYNLFAPEVDLNYVPTSTSLLGVGYRYANDSGRTPFTFDQRDMRHELRVRYQVGGPWAFGILTRYDMERLRSYETEVAILRNLDCLQYGIGYRFNAQQFNIIFNFVPPAQRANRQSKTP